VCTENLNVMVMKSAEDRDARVTSVVGTCRKWSDFPQRSQIHTRADISLGLDRDGLFLCHFAKLFELRRTRPGSLMELNCCVVFAPRNDANVMSLFH
jgi:hypothetical protein